MSINNKSLALLLVAAIVISLGGTLISLNKLSEIGIGRTGITGRAVVGTGQVNVTIDENSSCTAENNVDFGSGMPRQPRTLSTDINNNFDGFNCNAATPGTGNCWGLIVNNTGNVMLNITFNSSKTGAELLGAGHSDSDFMTIIDDTEIEANACTTEGITTWSIVNSSSTAMPLCNGLNFSDSRDVIVIDFNISIDQNTIPETKTTTITLTCIAA